MWFDLGRYCYCPPTFFSNSTSLWARPAAGSFFGLTHTKRTIMFNHMVKYSSHTLDKTFAALSDPTRRAILARLARGDASVTELAAPFAMSLPAISKHLRVLEQAGLVERTKDGRVHRLRLMAQPLHEAATWIAHYQHFWDRQLAALADYLHDVDSTEENKEQKP